MKKTIVLFCFIFSAIFVNCSSEHVNNSDVGYDDCITATPTIDVKPTSEPTPTIAPTATPSPTPTEAASVTIPYYVEKLEEDEIKWFSFKYNKQYDQMLLVSYGMISYYLGLLNDEWVLVEVCYG